MSVAFSFGSYYPGSGPLYRLDPRTKLLAGFVLLGCALASRSFAALGVIAAFVAVLYAMSRIPIGRALRSLAPLMVLALFVAVLNLFTGEGGRTLVEFGPLRITEGGVHGFLFMGARMTLMMCGMSLVTMTTMTLDLTHAVERLLAPLSRLGFPSHELGMMLGIALRFMPQFATELQTTYRAQVSRGARVGSGPAGAVRMLASVSVPLFASVFRHAETLAQAMDARCYHGEQGRTRLRELRFRACDGVAAAVMVLLAVLVVYVGALA